MQILKKLISTETDSEIHVGEAYILWTQLQAWYDVLELTEVLGKFANDADLKVMLEQADKLTKTNISKLERLMDKFEISFPQHGPKKSKTPSDTEPFRDEIIYRIIFDISQSAIEFHGKAINICTNDSLRNLFINFMIEEIHAYDNYIKHGKSKGWVHSVPSYKL